MFSIFLVLVAEYANNANGVLVKLVLSLVQLCKLAANHPGGTDIFGMKLNMKKQLWNLLRGVWTVFT